MTVGTVIIQTNLERSSEYSLQVNRWYLKPIGAWPTTSSTTPLGKIIKRILNVIWFSLILFTLIPSLLHLILDDESFYVKSKVFAFVSYWFISAINYTVFILRNSFVRECVEQMEYDWRIMARNQDQEVMLKNARLGRYVTIFCGLIFQSAVMFYAVLTSLTTETIVVGNETKIIHMLPCAVYKKLISVDHSPTYEIVLGMQMISTFIVNLCVTGILSLAAVLTAHACGQLNVLMTWITEFVNEPDIQDETTPFKQIKVIVEHHTKVLNFISHLEETMSFPWFMELFRCGLAICLLGYYTLVEWADGDVRSIVIYFVMLAAITFNAFLICYVGDLLTEQCRKVGEAVYMTEWYCLPGKKVHELMMIIARSDMVIQLTAGKLIEISIYTFSDVLKTGFAYLNILSQLI